MDFFYTRVNWGFIFSAVCRYGHVVVSFHEYQKYVRFMHYRQN
jgi:hypothetical protein